MSGVVSLPTYSFFSYLGQKAFSLCTLCKPFEKLNLWTHLYHFYHLFRVLVHFSSLLNFHVYTICFSIKDNLTNRLHGSTTSPTGHMSTCGSLKHTQFMPVCASHPSRKKMGNLIQKWLLTELKRIMMVKGTTSLCASCASVVLGLYSSNGSRRQCGCTMFPKFTQSK